MKRRCFLALGFIAGLFPCRARASDVGVITRLSGNNATIPEFYIGCIIKNSRTGDVIFDSREATGKHLTFPQCLSSLTAFERKQLMDHIGEWFLRRYMESYRD